MNSIIRRHTFNFFLTGLVFTSLFFVVSCKVTLITGYDQVVDETITKIKKDFNLHYIKLKRTIQDNDPNNQKFENFQDYYDHLEADLYILEGRSSSLKGKSTIVKKQLANVDSVMHKFISQHQKGFRDQPGDDRRDIRDGINSALDAVTKLQEEIKTTGTIKNK